VRRLGGGTRVILVNTRRQERVLGSRRLRGAGGGAPRRPTVLGPSGSQAGPKRVPSGSQALPLVIAGRGKRRGAGAPRPGITHRRRDPGARTPSAHVYTAASLREGSTGCRRSRPRRAEAPAAVDSWRRVSAYLRGGRPPGSAHSRPGLWPLRTHTWNSEPPLLNPAPLAAHPRRPFSSQRRARGSIETRTDFH
jgi:hypothetical protein